MKYFYNNNLVRTSNNEYHYGLLRNGICVKCSKERKGCETLITSELQYARKQVAYLEKNLDKNEKYKEYMQDFLDYINNTKWEIVELEAR